ARTGGHGASDASTMNPPIDDSDQFFRQQFGQLRAKGYSPRRGGRHPAPGAESSPGGLPEAALHRGPGPALLAWTGMTPMFEIVRKASRFTNDEPEVIAYADSRSEAEAMAHDLRVNVYRSSAYITVRRAGESRSRPDVPGSDLSIAYYDMTIEGFE